MELSKTNKTLIVCLIFIAGIISTLLNIIPWYIISLIFLGYYSISGKKISYRFALVCALLIIFSITYTIVRSPRADDLYTYAPIKTSIKGRVLTQPEEYSKHKTRFEFETQSYKIKGEEWFPIKARTQVTVYSKKRISNQIFPGDILLIEGDIKPPYKVTNPGQFDYGKYLANKRIFTFTYVNDKNLKIIDRPESGKWFFINQLNKIRNKIISTHRKYIKSPGLEVLGGFVFGEYAVPVPKDVKDNFINSGLLHLLAASGMNVGFIFGFWFFFSRWLFVPYRMAIIIGGMLVIFYALLTGLPPSVTRATWMLEFILLGKLIDREADNTALLALVCAIMLLFDPILITNIGFQLSFIVTFGLMIGVPVVVEKLKPIPTLISGSIVVPIIAQLWATPIQIYHFNNFATYSVLANIIVLPFVGLVSFLGFIGSIFSLLPVYGEQICRIIAIFVNPLIQIMLFVPKYISDLPDSLYYFATPDLLTVMAFYALVLSLTLQIRFDFSKSSLNFIIALAILTLSSIYLVKASSSDFKFTFFDVGEADSALIQTSKGNKILVDTGNKGRGYYDSAKTIIIPYLRDIGVNKLDTLILTHPDGDHIGGTVSILENIKVGQVFDNGSIAQSKIYKKVVNYISQNHIPLTHITRNSSMDLSNNSSIDIIRPPNTREETFNEESLILYIKFKNFSALLMGDCEADSLEYIKKVVIPPINLLKIGHHGSRNSVNDELINFLRPQVAVISAGKKFVHPHPETISILKNYGIKTYRTDQDHAIEITTDGNNLKVNPFSNNQAGL